MLCKTAISNFIDYLEKQENSNKTINSYNNSLNNFNSYLVEIYNCSIYLEDIKLENIENYLLCMKQRGCEPCTRNKSLFILRSFFNYICDRQLLSENLAKKLKPVKTRRKERVYLSKSEVKTLAQEIDHPIIANAVLTQFYSGLRPSELLNLKVNDVDIERKTIQVIMGKGNKDRVIPICEALKKIIINYLENVRKNIMSEKMFATVQSGGLSLQYYNSKIREAVNRLGWKKKVTAHILRHSFGSKLVQEDVNLEKIKTLLGHKSIMVTSIYCHSNPKSLTEAVNKL